jgi:hypothetical protein
MIEVQMADEHGIDLSQRYACLAKLLGDTVASVH